MFTSAFWRLAAERAVKSFAQSLVAILGISGIGLLNADWLTAVSTAGMAALLSVLTSVGSLAVGPEGDPSVVAQPPAPSAGVGGPSADAPVGAAA